MINAKKLTGAAVAAAAAALFISGCASMSQPASGGMSGGAQMAKVHCFGVNSCKGQSDCKSASNSCKGQNSCKGKGFLAISKSECAAKGGRAG